MCLRNAYQFKVGLSLHQLPFCHHIKGEFWDPQYLGLWGWDLDQSKAHPRLPQDLSIQSFALSAAVWLEFKCQIMPLPANSTRPTPKMVPIELSSPHSYSSDIYTRGLSCTVWPQYTTRQTDRAFGKCHLWYSIGGIRIELCIHAIASEYLETFPNNRTVVLTPYP